MEAKKIKVIVMKAKTKDGREFNTYRAVQKDGHLIQCKFRKEVKKLPEKSCYMFVYPENMNIQRNTEYPCLWVKEVEKYEDIETTNTSTVEELF